MIEMRRKPLSYYLNLQYPFRVQVDRKDGYFVTFPDLPGCLTGADKIEDLPAMIKESKSLWIEAEYEAGDSVPEPTYMEGDDYSGKFNVRLPKLLHRQLADTAEQSGVSLNQFVVSLLSAGDALARVERRIEDIEQSLRGEPKAAARVAESREAYVASPRRRTAKKTKGTRTK